MCPGYFFDTLVVGNQSWNFRICSRPQVRSRAAPGREQGLFVTPGTVCIRNLMTSDYFLMIRFALWTRRKIIFTAVAASIRLFLSFSTNHCGWITVQLKVTLLTCTWSTIVCETLQADTHFVCKTSSRHNDNCTDRALQGTSVESDWLFFVKKDHFHCAWQSQLNNCKKKCRTSWNGWSE